LQSAAGKPELRERDHLRARLDDEIRAGDPEVDHAVLDVLGHVAGAHEQQVDGRVRARHEQ
jgi:hypothetical protein